MSQWEAIWRLTRRLLLLLIVVKDYIKPKLTNFLFREKACRAIVDSSFHASSAFVGSRGNRPGFPTTWRGGDKTRRSELLLLRLSFTEALLDCLLFIEVES